MKNDKRKIKEDEQVKTIWKWHFGMKNIAVGDVESYKRKINAA